MAWLVIYEMDDYEPSIHEHDTEAEAMQDWNDNKNLRNGRKCVAEIKIIEGFQ